MSDAMSSPNPTAEPGKDASLQEQLHDWIHSNEQAAPGRERGVEVLQRIRDGLPLSPREQAIAEFRQAERNRQIVDYREKLDLEFTELENVQSVADGIGNFLVKPENAQGQLAEIAKLSDERPPEDTP